MRKVLPAVLLAFSITDLTAQTCAIQQSSVSTAQQQVQRDENAIRAVNPSLQTVSLQDWATDTEKKKDDILLESLEDARGILFAKAAESATDKIREAQEPTEIAGVKLPNGIGSIGTAQRNALIYNMEQEGLDNTSEGKVAIWAIRQAGSTLNKRQKLADLQKIPELLDAAQSSSELADSKTDVKAAAALLQIGASLAGIGGVAVAVGKAVFDSGSNYLNLYIISKSVNSLGSSVAQQLKAINALNVPLQNHVAQLQQARAALSNCQKAAAAAQEAQQKRQKEQCDMYQTFVDLAMKSVAGDQKMIDSFRNAADGPHVEGVKNWTAALQADLRLLNEDKEQLQKCRSQ